MSSEATTWAKAQKCPTARAKAVLICLAPYADAEGVAWAAVDVLVIETELGLPRTVQRGLADLKAAGLIEETGERQVYRGKLYPKYRLPLERGPANTRERLALERARSGVTPVSPQDTWGDTGDTPRGDNPDGLGVTLETPKKNQGNLQPNTQGARDADLVAGFEALEAACPPLMLANSNRDQALQAYVELAEAGEPVGKLAACAERMAAHPTTRKRDFAPVGLEKWLRWGRWRGWTEEALGRGEGGSAGPSAAARTPFADAGVRAEFVRQFGEGPVCSYLDPCGWDPRSRVITPRTMVARDWLDQRLRQWAGPGERPTVAAPGRVDARHSEGVK